MSKLSTESSLEKIYGPPGEGPTISRAQPPWVRREHQKSKDNRKKQRRCIEALKRGVPLEKITHFRYMKKKNKRNLLNAKEKLGL
jgi:hypothetical protein